MMSRWTASLIALIVGVTAISGCARQESVFGEAGPSKPPTTVQTGNSRKFTAAALGETSTTLITLSVRGGHLPKVLESSLTGPFRWAGDTDFPGSGGTCNPDGLVDQCRIAVEFVPEAEGSFSGQVRVAYERNSTTQSVWSQSIVAATPARLEIVGSGTIDFGSSYVGQEAATRGITLRHLQGGTATNFELVSGATPVYFEGVGRFPGVTGTCASSVSASTCSATLVVRAERTGVFNDSITLRYHDGKEVQLLTFSATGSVTYPPKLTLLPVNQDIGQVFVGGQGTIPLVVRYDEGDIPATGLAFLGIQGEMSFPGGSYPGSGGTCGAEIFLGTCTLNLAITPSTAGAQTRTLTLLYRSGSKWYEAKADFSFTAVPPARLTLSPASVDFGTVAAGSASLRMLTLSHDEGQPSASQISASLPSGFRFAGGSYPGTGGNCTTTLLPGSSCTLAVEFAPTNRGTYSGNLAVNYQGGIGTSSLTAALIGKTEANLSLSLGSATPAGSILTGASSQRTLTLTHLGGATATSLSGSLPAGTAFTILSTTCGASLGSGSCTYTIRFAPATAGSYNETFALSFHNGVMADSASLGVTATAVAAATLEPSASPLDFGELVTTGSRTIALQISTPPTSGVSATSISVGSIPSPFFLVNQNCPPTLAAGATCTITIRATPSTSGVSQRSFSISYHDGVQTRSLAVPLTVTGRLAATLSFHPTTTLNFGSVLIGQTSDPQLLEVRHTSGELSATSLSASLDSNYRFTGGSYPGTSGTCGTELAPGASCLMEVTFMPNTSGTVTRNATLSYYNGAIGQSATRSLTGSSNGKPAFSGDYHFGDKAVGSSTDATLTVTFQGNTPVTGMTGSITGSTAYSFIGGAYPGTGGTCGAALSSGSCTVRVRFTPTASGSPTATLSLAYDSGAGAMTSSMTLRGTAQVVPVLTLTGTGSVSGMKVTGSSTPISLTLTHSGGGQATSLSGLAPATPFKFAGGSYPGTGGNCSSALSAGTSCTIRLVFEPTSSGDFSATVGVSYFNGLATAQASKALSASAGISALVTASESNLNFGQISLGQSSTLEFTLTNRASAVPATSMQILGINSPFSIASQNCTSLSPGLEAGSSCTISVRFTASTHGRYSGTLQFRYSNGSSTQTVNVALSATTPSGYQLSPADGLDIGDRAVGGTHPVTFTLTRTGGPTSTALMASIDSESGVGSFHFLGGSFPGTGGTCSNPMTSDSCTIVVAFSLPSIGEFSGTWSLTAETGAGEVTLTRTLGGEAKTQAFLLLSDDSLVFPSASPGSSSQAALVVQNVGGMALSSLSGTVSASTVGAFQFSGGSFPGLGGSCSTSLLAGKDCTVVLDFAPPASTSYTGTVTIQGHDGLATVTESASLSHTSGGTSAKPSLRMLSAPGRWAIRDVDGDGLWDQLVLADSNDDFVSVIGSTTSGEIARISREEAAAWLSF